MAKSTDTAQSLKANQNGKLTDSQVEQLKPLFKTVRQRRTNSIITAVVVGVLGYFFATSGSFKNLSPYAIAGALAAIAVFIVYTLVRTFLESRDVLQHKISVVEGMAQHKTGHTRAGRLVHVVQIGTVKFYVNEQVFKAFVQGQPYKVYYIKFPPANVLLSVE
jgi:hypothetical protein